MDVQPYDVLRLTADELHAPPRKLWGLYGFTARKARTGGWPLSVPIKTSFLVRDADEVKRSAVMQRTVAETEALGRFEDVVRPAGTYRVVYAFTRNGTYVMNVALRFPAKTPRNSGPTRRGADRTRRAAHHGGAPTGAPCR